MIVEEATHVEQSPSPRASEKKYTKQFNITPKNVVPITLKKLKSRMSTTSLD